MGRVKSLALQILAALAAAALSLAGFAVAADAVTALVAGGGDALPGIVRHALLLIAAWWRSHSRRTPPSG